MRQYIVVMTITDDGVDPTKAEATYLLSSEKEAHNYIHANLNLDSGIDINIRSVDELIP